MMRAVLFVTGLVTLAVMELRTPPRIAKAAPDSFEQLTIGTNPASDTAPKGDRLDIARAPHQPPTQQILFAERLPQPDVKLAVPQKEVRTKAKPEIKPETKTVEPRKSAATAKPAQTKPKPQAMHAAAKMPAPPERPKKLAAIPDRPKAAGEKSAGAAKPCRLNAFDQLLSALSLSRGCET